MSNETCTPRGRLITRLGSVVLALPLLYLVSSGPLMHYALVHDMAHLSRPPVSTLPERTSAMSHLYPPVRSFYEPLFRTAAVTHLEQPLLAYLIAWKLYPLRTKEGEILLANVAKPKVTLAGKTGTARHLPSAASATPASGSQ